MGPNLEIYLDPKDPYAYFALAGTLELLAQSTVTAHWRPLQQPTLGAPQTAVSKSRGDRHRAARAEYRDWELSYYANVLGLELRDIYSPCDSSLAAMGMLWLEPAGARDVGPYLQQLLEQHWRGQRMDTLDTVAAALPNNGVGFAEFCAKTGRAALSDATKTAAEIGIFRGPAYRLNDELFIGREHLPMLRWYINGQTGPAPV